MYRFFTDDQATEFLLTHFPVEVWEAFDSFVSGANKADLFRTCVLLINGGAWADVDLRLDAPIDDVVPPDLQFGSPFASVRTVAGSSAIPRRFLMSLSLF